MNIMLRPILLTVHLNELILCLFTIELITLSEAFIVFGENDFALLLRICIAFVSECVDVHREMFGCIMHYLACIRN